MASPRVSGICTFLVELLAAVSSVIYGLLAIFTLAPLLRQYIEPALKNTLGFLPLFQGQIYGVSYLAAAMILAIMIFPFIISISREALLAVPKDQREAAPALGATKRESTWQVVVPFARLGIIGLIFMAVTMVIGNDPSIHASLFAPGYTIAAVVANEFAEATGDIHLSALIELGLALFVLTMILNGSARLLIVATTRKGSKQQT
jgi:phosphate transport system permease protein